MSISPFAADPAALEAMTREAVRTLRRRGASLQEAEDSVQDALVDACRLAEPPVNPAAWLNVVGQRRHVDHIRKVGRETPCAAFADGPDRTNRDPSDRVSDAQQARWLVDQLDGLPRVAQEVCHAVGAGMPVDEIAAELGITVRAVEGHLTRTRKILRRLASLGVWPGLPTLPRWLRPSVVVPAVAPAVIGTVIGLPSFGTPDLELPDRSTSRYEVPAGPSTGPTPSRTAPATRISPPAEVAVRPGPARPAPSSSPGPATAPAPARRSPLDNPVVPVTRHNGTSGPPSSQPVAVIVHCLSTSTVSIDKIGC